MTPLPLSGLGPLVRQRASGADASARWSLVSASRRPGALPLDVVVPLASPSGFGFHVADGARGDDGGRAAALAVAACVGGIAPGSAELACETLADADMDVASNGIDGEASAAVAVLSAGRIHGASAGDCEVWLFAPGSAPLRLTAAQNRRPRLGGSAAATPFTADMPRGSVAVVGSDGLWVNAAVPEVAAVAARVPTERLADALLAYVWTRSGGRLPDDVAVGAFSA